MTFPFHHRAEQSLCAMRKPTELGLSKP